MKPPRGTQDILPPLSERFTAHESRGAEIFERAGYGRIVTPMFEETEVFVRGVGAGTDIVSKEMYTFEDRSGNSLTLRPEGTAPVIRAIISEKLWNEGVPVKLWYSAAMFRYDRPQKGRYRQHHQLGIEAVGVDDPAIDAEVIAIGAELLRKTGVGEVTLLLNSIGHPGCRDEYLPRLKQFLEEHRDSLDADCHRRMETNPLRVFDCKNERDQKTLADAPMIEQFLCDECRAHFDAVQSALKDLGIAFALAPRLVRGLDYYTRTTFEFQTPLLESQQNTLLGGGRYDGLSEMLGGPSLPGIGFGSGIERVLLAQELAGAAEPTPRLGAFVVPLGAEERPSAFRLVAAIREAGVSADMAYAEKGLKAQLRHADRLGARFGVLIGPAEREAGACTIRDMTSGEQRTVPLSEAPAQLAAALR
ncbi:MAG TPA: histidine--tRNA ligase [Actinomycetota bacterium]|nr:histidine--tRNA ligase [Actinomycetota bacterium]